MSTQDLQGKKLHDFSTALHFSFSRDLPLVWIQLVTSFTSAMVRAPDVDAFLLTDVVHFGAFILVYDKTTIIVRFDESKEFVDWFLSTLIETIDYRCEVRIYIVELKGDIGAII
jgi:hypothetical protein